MFGLIKKIFIGLLTGLVIGSNCTKCFGKQLEICMTRPTLLIYILTNKVKNFTTIHLCLTYVDVLEAVILLMTCLIKYVFQIKQKI